jgi:hypothetical protein
MISPHRWIAKICLGIVALVLAGAFSGCAARATYTYDEPVVYRKARVYRAPPPVVVYRERPVYRERHYHYKPAPRVYRSPPAYRYHDRGRHDDRRERHDRRHRDRDRHDDRREHRHY